MRNERIAIDTNILLYILGGDKSLASLLAGKDVVASAMVRMEAMVYHGKDEGHLEHVHAFLRRCEVVEIHRSVQDLAVDLRLRYKLKLPDAIIAATATHLGIPLITADKVFSKLDPEFEVVVYGK
ncbi:MAG: type II toxin-antitoxin system VapC family toxin [Flavobacteriales bacterium]|nr:type II toxin-antitoxin system VapC family toxin [Flavobacteriales bacterium]